jgi:hypothetical protein
LILISCVNPKRKISGLENLFINDIKSATIIINKNDLITDSIDTLRIIPFEHIDLITNTWNKSNDIGLVKFFPSHIVEIKYKTGETERLRLAGKMIKRNNDCAVSADFNLADSLWILSYKYYRFENN